MGKTGDSGWGSASPVPAEVKEGDSLSSLLKPPAAAAVWEPTAHRQSGQVECE